MSLPTPAQLADGVRDAWNGTAVRAALGVDAVRTNRPRLKVRDLGDDVVRITVAPRSIQATAITRGSTSVEFPIDIAIQKKIDAANEDAQIDAMTQRVVETIEQMIGQTVAGVGFVSAATTDPLFDPEQLDEHNVFTGVIALTIKTIG